MLVLLLLDKINMISFGIDGGDAFTGIIMLLICFISLFIFAAMNRVKKESLTVNAVRAFLVVLMIVVVAFLLNDLSWK